MFSFGATAATATKPAFGTPFGSSTPAAVTQQASTAAPAMSLTNFGNTTTTNAPLFGASAPAAGGLVGGAGPLAAVTLSTRYNDLPDAVRQQVDEIEKFIKSQVQIAESLDATTVSQSVSQVQEQTVVLKEKLAGLKTVIESDELVMNQLKVQVFAEMKHADWVGRFLEKAKSSQGQSKFALQQSQDPFFNYFVEFAHSLEHRIHDYKLHMEQLESSVKTASAQYARQSPQAIQETIRRQQNALLFLANQIAHVHSQVEDALKAFVEFAKKYQVEEMLRVSDQLSVNLKDKKGSGVDRESLSDMASNLQPEQQQQQQTSSLMGGSMFGAKPLFGGSSAPTPLAAATAPTTGLSLFGKK